MLKETGIETFYILRGTIGRKNCIAIAGDKIGVRYLLFGKICGWQGTVLHV